MFAKARLRLVVSYMAVLSLILVGLSLAVFTMFQDGLYADVDASLKDHASPYAQYLADGTPQVTCDVPSADMSVDISEGIGYAVMNCYHQTVVSNMTAYSTGVAPADMSKALEGHPTIRTLERSGHYWRAYSAPITVGPIAPNRYAIVGAVQLYRLADGQVHALHHLEVVLILGGIAALVLSGGAGLFLAGRTLSPIKSAFEHQRRFIADASHELRTPLALIRGSAEMVASTSDRLTPDDSELLGDIVNEVDRVSKLVGDLLILARVDNSQIELERSPVDLAEVAREAHADVEPLAIQKGLASRVDAEIPAIVLGDGLRLRQLLLILLDNAMKYTEPGGVVETGVAAQNGHVALSVSDTGAGIPAESIPHVFERFYRADGARTHESGGAGLGLSIADWIVKAHQGKIQIDSAVGRGTKVTVELPAAKVESEI